MTQPRLFEPAFICPHCTAYAHHRWAYAAANFIGPKLLLTYKESWRTEAERGGLPELSSRSIGGTFTYVDTISFSLCSHCDHIAIWHGDRLVLPKVRAAPPANADMPEEVAADYNEAALILEDSPRGSAALLRLALQKLCKHLGEPGKNIDTDIKSLVKKGLNIRIQQSLDAVRVIGNEAVHPGTIDLRDDRGTATMLFNLLNLVVDKMISEPKHVQAVYDMLPESKRKGIERRDS